MALVLEYLPLVVFFVVYQMVDIFAATWALMGLTIVQLVGLKLLKQPITTRHWIVLGAVLVFGGITDQTLGVCEGNVRGGSSVT